MTTGFRGLLERARGALRPDERRPPIPDPVLRGRSIARTRHLLGLLGVGYLVLAAQAWRIMLVPDERLELRARTQFESTVTVEGRRGDILDRNGEVLATTVRLDALHLDPARIPEELVAPLARLLAERLDLSESRLRRRLSRRSRRDVVVARGLEPARSREIEAAVAALAGRRHPPAWVWTHPEPTRFYPAREEAGPLIGLVGRSRRGLVGVERAWDATLRGGVLKYVQWRDARGRWLGLDEPVAEAGRTLVLTLDRRIQHVAEEALDHAVEATAPAAAMAVVMDPRTGEILAVANRPTQNPNDTANLDLDALRNRAVGDAFEPGSVFKPFLVAAALEAGVVAPETPIDCEGGAWRVPGGVIHDHEPEGVIPVWKVVQVSSNIGAAKIALRLGAERTMATYRDFGFGRPPGTGLVREGRGTLRDPRRTKPIELATAAYGHGISATVLQLASAMSALANDGVRMRPMLVREVRDAHGHVVERFDPEPDRRVVSEEVAREVVRMMERVVQPGGTAPRARVPGYRVAGKTGTADKYVPGVGYSPTDRVGSFVGLVPADDPRLVIAVTIDTPTKMHGYGGLVAAPVFREIAERAMRLLGVPPDPDLLAETDEDAAAEAAERDAPPAAPRADRPRRPDLLWAEDGRLRLPDLRGLSLRDALVALQGSGLAVAARGSGLVARQEPPPGSRVRPGDRVEVVLR